MSDAAPDVPLIAPADLAFGLLVRHTARPEWGLGKVLHVDGSHVHVYFRDAPGTATEAVRVLSKQASHLVRADAEHDLLLDHLPPLVGGRFPSRYQHRITALQAIDYFITEFDSFESPRFLRDERDYTSRAHDVVSQWFTGEEGRQVLATGAPDAVAHRLGELLRLTGLLSKQELAGLNEAFRDTGAAVRYGAAVLAFVASPAEPTFGRLVDATASLSVASEKARVLTWPVVTALPYLACPRDCVFLKPDLARRLADALCFDLLYDARPRWSTYQRLVRLSTHLLSRLRPLGARDFIDVHSFAGIVAGSPLMKAKGH
jgi:hypothetical protein